MASLVFVSKDNEMRECTKIIPRLFLFNNIIAKLLYPKYSNASTMTKLEVTFANPLTEIVVALT